MILFYTDGEKTDPQSKKTCLKAHMEMRMLIKDFVRAHCGLEMHNSAAF